MDILFESDIKAYISPVINIGEFCEKALEAQKKLTEYFQLPAQAHLHELQTSSTEGPLQVDQAALEADCRLSFKYFLNSKGIGFDEADEVINYMDDTLQDLLITNPIDNLQSSFPPLDSKLKIHKVFHTFRQEKDLRKIKNRYLQKSKYYGYRPGELRKGYTDPGKTAQNDIVITAHLLGPNQNPKKIKAETRLMLRGDMPLVKLRDKIFCAYDYFSNLQDYEDATNPEDYYLNRYPSAFIFIHDTFYIDKRNPNSQDISEPIRRSMASKKDFGPTKVADIMEYKIKDLNLRLGQPYIFIHLGDCEHLLFFTDLKLLHPSDNQEMDFYPVFLSDKRTSPKCCVCKNESATFIISESDRIPLHPAFMCTPCFNTFHYEGDNRIGTFRAFHYIEHGIFE
uniref:snRNA-activating protein complex subunit 3 n=1 Tax=Panagrolaimus sp. PS1159 TaxID=55785 RepID=A0AC35FKU6_9BILA